MIKKNINFNELIDEVKNLLNEACDIYSIELIHSKYLGKNGKLTNFLKNLGEVEKDKRPEIGKKINLAKQNVIRLVEERSKIIQEKILEESLSKEAIDITLPARGQSLGTIHPITHVTRIIEKFFTNMGFSVVSGPEIEDEFYNFTALNIPKHHPSRTLHDTFYFADDTMLRSQTSPAQIHAMQKMKPPIRIISPGKVFRRDSDATHSPMFHQLEILIVDKDVNFSNLKWLINKFIEYFFKEKVEYRIRPSFFPFTGISAEVDIKWKSIGKSEDWLELGGCGVVHPNVLEAGGVDSKSFCGLAFGFGIERLAMVYYGINNIKLLFENDLQFLKQF